MFMTSLSKQNYLSELRDLDWDFEGQTGADGLAGYHWYPARYVPQVPAMLIGYLSAKGDNVLDPFCGSGTTLVEAQRLGRRSHGIDTNPAAILMATAKLVPFDANEWKDYTESLVGRINRFNVEAARDPHWLVSSVPQFDEQSDWYHPDTLAELAQVFRGIRDSPGLFQVVADAAFSSILRSSCSQDKHWGWVCDNVKPKALSYRPALKAFLDKFYAYGQIRSAAPPDASVSALTTTGNCVEVLKTLPAESFDLVVTSPPYYSMTDYIRSQRLTFLWFDWDLYELKRLESGARYKRHRKSALEQYLDDMDAAFEGISRVLRSGKSCGVVIGESPNRAPYLDDLRDIMSDRGLKIETRIRRRVATQRTFAELEHEEIILARRK